MNVLKQYRGLWFVLSLYVLNAVLWLTATPIIEQPLDSVLLQMHGASILLGFTLVFFLSTKNKVVEQLFGGLEHSYRYHRVLAMVSLLFIFIHAQFAYLIFQVFREGLWLDGRAYGALARNLFIGLIVIALLAKYMKYEHWRMIHRLMILPYLFAAYHAFLLSSYRLVSLTPLGLWMMAMIGTGVASSLYMILLYHTKGLPYQGEVIRVTHLNDDVTELEIAIKGHYDYQTGQFAFIKIKDPLLKEAPHPFSISGRTEQSLIFTIKALGDYTKQLKTSLSTGMPVRLSRAFGHMTFDDYQSKQIWVAGGIGITPFLSHLRSLEPPTQAITLYYAVNSKEEAVHLPLLKSLKSSLPTFDYVLVESDKTGFLTAEDLQVSSDTSVFMCGPRVMVLSLKKQLHKQHKDLDLTVEAFSFTGTLVEDLIRQLKRGTRWLKKLTAS